MTQDNASAAEKAGAAAASMLAPLRVDIFRRIWSASLLSNFGLLIGGVGGAWAMTQLTTSADIVALVQTAISSPVMLVAIWAGAMADMYDRRKLAILALCVSLSSAATLAGLAFYGALTPHNLLALLFMMGCGTALFGPAWQSSVSEQVPTPTLPAAIALNGVSYNIARSFGPAIGGVIVAAAGASAAFAVNALTYLPLLIILIAWRRVQAPSRLPPERLFGAVVSGLRYVRHSPPLRILLVRVGITGMIGGSALALMPLIVRDQLHGDARTFGLMLGSFGLGAVLAAFQVPRVRRHFDGEGTARLCALAMGVALVIAGFSHWALLTSVALIVAGAGWMVTLTLFNVSIQTSAPRWVAGRALSAYQATSQGGIAVGSWIWGSLAERIEVGPALVVAGVAMLLSPLLGLALRIPNVERAPEVGADLADPEVSLALTPRSGPVILEIEYRVAEDQARDFYRAMQDMRLMRHRNGAFGWSIARDVTDPQLWIERFHFPTWLDYLRHRNRPTRAERALTERARSFHIGTEPVRLRRMLERPFGSVRWRDETPDRDEPLPSNGG